MLRQVLRSLVGKSATPAAQVNRDFPVAELRRRNRLFESAPVDTHLDILYRDCRIGAVEFLPLYRACLARSQTQVSAWKAFIRVQSALNLAHYFLHALGIPGRRVECGVFRGFSALLLCETARAVRGYDGEALHLVDSFAGFAAPGPQDFIPLQDRVQAFNGAAFSAGDGAAPEPDVRALLSAFPQVSIHRGWIPEVYSSLPDGPWSFVHIDVDLYAATLSSLEFFFPRLARGGVIVCDDYGSTLFPGARNAWDEFCSAAGLAYVVLETGQAVLIHS
jgi:hypothetical protein